MQDKWHPVFHSSKQQDTWLQKTRDRHIRQDSWPRLSHKYASQIQYYQVKARNAFSALL